MATAPDPRPATLADVAARAAVSPMTASYAFSQPQRVSAPTREKVLAAAAELGYVGPDPSARSLRRGHTSSLGVVLGEHLSYAFDDPQAAAFLAGIADVCAERSYAMTILPTTGGPEDTKRIRVAAVDGFVVWTTADDDPVLAALQSLHSRVVIHGGPAIDGAGLVSVDNRAAAREIATVTFSGARRPAVLSFPLDRRREPASAPRSHRRKCRSPSPATDCSASATPPAVPATRGARSRWPCARTTTARTPAR